MTYIAEVLIGFFRPFLTRLFITGSEKFLVALLFVVEPIYTTIKAWLFKMPFFVVWLGIAYVLYSALVSGLSVLLSGFMPVISPAIVQSAGWFLPSNVFECMTLVYASKMYRFAYDHKVAASKAKLVTSVS
jgi:hypothetical protein